MKSFEAIEVTGLIHLGNDWGCYAQVGLAGVLVWHVKPNHLDAEWCTRWHRNAVTWNDVCRDHWLPYELPPIDSNALDKEDARKVMQVVEDAHVAFKEIMARVEVIKGMSK